MEAIVRPEYLEELHKSTSEQEFEVLSDLQLALIGGGIGDVVFG